MTDIATMISVLSALIALAAAYFTFGQMKLAKTSVVAQYTVKMMEQWASEPVQSARYRLREKLPECIRNTPAIASFGYTNLPDDIRTDAIIVSNFFNYLGIMCHAKYADEKLILRMFARPILMYWGMLSPLLHTERQQRPNPPGTRHPERYHFGFEHLAVAAREFIDTDDMSHAPEMDQDTKPPFAL